MPSIHHQPVSMAMRRYQAYRHLGVNPNEVAAASQITQLIKKNIPGGWHTALAYLRTSDHPDARHFISVYDDLTLPAGVRKLLPVEAFAIKAGLLPSQLYETIVQVVRRQSALDGVLIAASAHPAIVQKSSELALEGDINHVTHNLKHMGFLPLPKGAQVSIQVNASATAASASQSIAAAPAPENTIRRLVNRFNTVLPVANPIPALTEGKESASLRMPSQAGETVIIDADYNDTDRDEDG
jgi:hypothetical protein